jgi:hypothetical protein
MQEIVFQVKSIEYFRCVVTLNLIFCVLCFLWEKYKIMYNIYV